MQVHTQAWDVRRLKILLMTMCILLKPSLSAVHRLYSPTSEIGHSHACESDRVILTCHATGSQVTWTATSDLFARIIFLRSDATWRVINQGAITGILLQNEPVSEGSDMRNFISELLVYTTSSTTSINVTCSSDSGSSSHVIEPPALPGQPIFKEPRLLVQTDLTAQYYLEWEPPSNHQNFDLDHYQLFSSNDSLIRVHSDQHYAVITIQKGVTTTVKLAAADKCGQISSNTSVSITPSIVSTPGDEHKTRTTTIYDNSMMYTTTKGQNFHLQENSSSSDVVAIIICTTLVVIALVVALIVVPIAILVGRRSRKHFNTELVKDSSDSKTASLDVDFEAALHSKS